VCAIYSHEAWNDAFSFDSVSDTVECFTAMLKEFDGLPYTVRKIHIKQHTTPWDANSNVISAKRDKLNFTIMLCVLVILQYGNSITVLVTKLTGC